MQKVKMLSGLDYTGDEVRRAKAIIKKLNFNITVEQDMENEIVYAIGNENEIKAFFTEARKK